MHIRGIDEAIEFKRLDYTPYKGIVVKNDDPNKLYRVKVFIPELSNQPLQDWLNTYKKFAMRFPGKNNKKDAWSDTKMFEEIAALVPWAEPCFPLMGESGPGRYNSPDSICTISDSDYEEGWQTLNTEPPTLEKGSYSPAYLFQNTETMLSDPFAEPINYMANNNNPYTFIGKPSKHVNKAKGVFGVPSVGAKVWVFHYNGDPNFPVYFGTSHDFRETSLINNLDQKDAKLHSQDYPGIFENSKREHEEEK